MSDFNRIIINEIDETTPNRADSIVDVVSIIGFPGVRGTSLSDNIKPSVKDANDKEISIFTINIDNTQCNRAFEFNSLADVKSAAGASKFTSKTIEFRTVDAQSKPIEAGWYIPQPAAEASETPAVTYSNPVSLSSYGIVLNTNGYALENGTKIVLDFYAEPFVYCKSASLVPQYLETIAAFEDMFGTAPMQFTSGDEVIYDKSYIYAKELLNAGLPIVYTAVAVKGVSADEYNYSEDISKYSLQMMKDSTQIGKICEVLKDRNSYTIKYVTLGGYASFDVVSSPVDNGIAELLLGVCLDRGDCVALIDTNDTEDLNSSQVISAFRTSPVGTNNDGAYATCIYPWGDYRCLTIVDDKDTYKDERIQAMPGSFGYLLALAKSIKTNANWLAIAGATRGQVPQLIRLRSKNKITAAIADSFQEENKININAITEINPYGLCIWGNRTLKNNTILNGTTATSFLNIRNLVSDVKKVVYRAAKRLLFEQNSDILWVNFQSEIMTTLEQMKSGAGISGYKIIRLPSDKKTKVKAQVIIYPIYAVEQIEVTITLRDEEVDVQAQ